MQNQVAAKTLPSTFVGKEITNDRIKRFLMSRQLLLNKSLGRPDTQSVWYTFQQIEDIYNEMVYLGADGLRLYFGAYESDHEEFPDQTCLLMVPTRLNPDTMKHKDIILEDEPGFELRTKDIPKGFNYGSPCPPVCNLQEPGYPL